MKVSNLIADKGSEIIMTTAGESVAETAKLLRTHKIGAVLVRDPSGGQVADIAGIISERDIINGVAEHGHQALDMNVGDLMTANVQVCSSEDTVHDVMTLMTEKRFRHVPVVDDGKLVGLISIGDVVKHRIAETEEEAQALREYITTA